MGSKKGAKKRGRKEKKSGQEREKTRKSDKPIWGILTRYILLILLSVKNLWIFYFLFTPLTLYPATFLLGLFYKVTIYQQAILVDDYLIAIVKACVAGSAYYLLLILNLTTRNIKIRKRIGIFLFDAFMLLLLNIARIFILAILQLKEMAFFDVTHKIFWYGISTAYVFLIWIATIKIFKIREIPFYSDFIWLKNQIKSGKGKKIKERQKRKERQGSRKGK